MKKINLSHAAFFLLLFASSHASFSQDISIVHLKKEKPFLFFQKGEQNGTLQKNKNDEFYLSVPDSLIASLSILTENGQLLASKGDSIYKFVYLKGLKYESLFLRNEKDKQHVDFKVLINGATDYDPKKIRIQLFNRKTNLVILENIYSYPP